MNTSGIIFQYIDKPAVPDSVVVDAYRSYSGLQSKELSKPYARTFSDVSNISRQIKVDNHDAVDTKENINVSIREDNVKTTSLSDTLKKQLSFSFRAMIGGGVIGLLVLIAPFIIIEAEFRLYPPIPQEEITFPDIEIVNDIVDTPTFSKLVNDKYIKKLSPINEEYALVIPKIGVNSPIVAHVDSGNKEEYIEALKKGAAQAKGTALPDEAGSQYIFAHSTDYIWNITQFNAIFYLLKDLEIGDQVHIVYKGKLYPYRVSEKKIVNADDTFYMKKNLNDNRLILQTCYPPGTTWKRMLVFAEPIDSILGSGDAISYSLDKSDID